MTATSTATEAEAERVAAGKSATSCGSDCDCGRQRQQNFVSEQTNKQTQIEAKKGGGRGVERGKRGGGGSSN